MSGTFWWCMSDRSIKRSGRVWPNSQHGVSALPRAPPLPQGRASSTFLNVSEAESLQTFLHTWADKCGETSDLNPRGLRFKSSTIYFKIMLSTVMLHQYFSSDCSISADCLKPAWNAEHFTRLLFHKWTWELQAQAEFTHKIYEYLNASDVSTNSSFKLIA